MSNEIAKLRVLANERLAAHVASEKLRMVAEAERDAARAQVAALREALRVADEMIFWMSGSADFGEGGVAHKGWLRLQKERDQILAALDSPAPSRLHPLG